MTNATQNYYEFLRSRFGTNNRNQNDFLPDFLHINNDRLFYRDIDLVQLSQEWGTPLEVGFNPAVTSQISRMRNYFAQAFLRKNYNGHFTYCYASKAAQYEDLIRTALNSGANYETSSPMDVMMARLHWKAGNLPGNRVILCNGFKTAQYVANIVQMKREGFQNIIPVIESELEIEAFARTGLQFELGIRLRVDKNILPDGDFSRVTSRFGIPKHEVMRVAERIAATPGLKPVMFHAMIDTQCIDRQSWVKALLLSFSQYCQLRQKFPSMRAFNFGGGMPVPYSLDFQFDYQAFADELTGGIMNMCAEYGVPHPEIIGEFGRYTAAAYGFDIYKVEVVKPSHNSDIAWYVINGSLMSSLPDTWALKQQFIILPLSGFDRPLQKAWLCGMTCDSDDVYKSDDEDGAVWLPEIKPGEELTIGVFMTGAYQDMLSGIGGVHHCLLPEPSELVIEEGANGGYKYRCTAPAQSLHTMANLLGYQDYLPYLNDKPQPVLEPVAAISRELRDNSRQPARFFGKGGQKPRRSLFSLVRP
jgi:arginine decarboxylase